MMKITWNRCVSVACLAGSFWIMSRSQADESPDKTRSGKPESPVHETAVEEDTAQRVPLAVAKDRAQTMHHIYVATLDVMHHRYFHANRAVVPARALEDVFAEIKGQMNMDARWIAVSLPAMSIDNEPSSEFEKLAARELGRGQESVEAVEDGYYRRAGAIPLTGGCINCHSGVFNPKAKSPKFAGLVISIPITDAGDGEKAAK